MGLFIMFGFTERIHNGILKKVNNTVMKTGLALGGGGVRGIAHIAYIEAMERAGIFPDIISGTSSGAIVGALYAGGMSPREICGVLEDFLKTAKRLGLALLKRKKDGGRIASFVRDYLSRVLPVDRFEELRIPLKIVATDFHTLREKVFDSEDILPALMGSIALPSVFVPQFTRGAYYMDGGATNIVPFDIIRDLCDVLIAIDVSLVRPNDYKPSTKNALRATWAATHETLIALKLKSCSVEIFERPSFDKASTMEFQKYKHIYNQAQAMTPAFIEKINKYIL